MQFRDYQRLSELINEAREIMCTHQRPHGKTKPINKSFDKALKNVDEAKSELENLMYLNCPQEASIYVFYPSTDPCLNPTVNNKIHVETASYTIDREIPQGNSQEAVKRVKFCLDQIEKYGFKKQFYYSTEIAYHCMISEVLGALIACEQTLQKTEKAQ